MWKIIKTETENHTMITNTSNKYFISVADSIINNVKSCNNDHKKTSYIKCLLNSFKHPFPNIQWFYTTTGDIENIIKFLKTKNSCGYDEIPIKTLKISAPFINSPLTYICNVPLLRSFPQQTKIFFNQNNI